MLVGGDFVQALFRGKQLSFEALFRPPLGKLEAPRRVRVWGSLLDCRSCRSRGLGSFLNHAIFWQGLKPCNYSTWLLANQDLESWPSAILTQLQMLQPSSCGPKDHTVRLLQEEPTHERLGTRAMGGCSHFLCDVANPQDPTTHSLHKRGPYCQGNQN